MATTTGRITCLPEVYTQVLTGSTIAKIKINRGLKTGGARLAIAAAQPAVNSVDYVEVNEPDKFFDLPALSVGDIVYIMPMLDQQLVVEFIKN